MRQRLKRLAGLLASLALFSGIPYTWAATVTVTTLADDLLPNGNCTLREAIRSLESLSAVDACTVESSTGATIELGELHGVLTLTLGEILISTSMLIAGPGSSELQLSGNGSSRIFRITEAELVIVSWLGFTSATTAVSVSNAKVFVADSRFVSNSVGISSGGDVLVVRESTFEQNGTGISAGGDENAVLRVTRCLITNNERGLSLGGDGSFTIEGSTISDNELFIPRSADALYNGGAGLLIQNYGGGVIKNTTISGNIGGGIWAGRGGGGQLIITNSTIYGNERAEARDLLGRSIIRTGGISRFISSHEIVLHSTIVAGNDGYDLGSSDPIASEGYNLIGIGSTDFAANIGDQIGVNDIALDPMLGQLAYNGGPTPTHALLSGSPAIDTGSCGDLLSDQRGYSNPTTGSRAIDMAGYNNFWDGCDVGAFEFNAVGVGIEVQPEVPGSMSEGFVMSHAYPNPFSKRSSFTLVVSETQKVRVEVFDLLGRRVQVLNSDILKANTPYVFVIEGYNLPSGVYIYHATGETFKTTGKVVLTR